MPPIIELKVMSCPFDDFYRRRVGSQRLKPQLHELASTQGLLDEVRLALQEDQFLRLHKSFVVELADHLLLIVGCFDHLRKLLEVHFLISGLNLAQLPLEVHVKLVVHSIADLALSHLEVLSVRKDVVFFHY